MAVKTTAVTVATTATRLDTVAESDDRSGSSMAPYNNSGVTVYVGGADVTTANGAPVPAASWGPAFNEIGTGEGVYGIVAAGTAEVRVLEQGI